MKSLPTMRLAPRAFSAPVLAPTVPKKRPQFGAGGNLRQRPDNRAAKDLRSYPSPHAPAGMDRCLGAQRNTPAEIVNQLNKEISAGLRDPKNQGTAHRSRGHGTFAFAYRLRKADSRRN